MTEGAFTVAMQLVMLHALIGSATYPTVAYLLGKPEDDYAALFWITVPLAAPCALLVSYLLAAEYLGLALVAATLVHLFLVGVLWARNRWRSLRGELLGELRVWEAGSRVSLPKGLYREVDGSITVRLEDHAGAVAWWVSVWMLSIPSTALGPVVGRARRYLYDRLQELAER